MPRANRYIQPGHLYHLTHRCHNRQFLFKFGVTRTEYRQRLRLAAGRHKVSLLNYSITCNHTHLLAEAADTEAISSMMQQLEGEFAEWYNRCKGRSGAFWSDRYHCTMVARGRYAWNCLQYIDLNMVRAGVVRHPDEWRWCGYDELTGQRSRYRLVDLDSLQKWFDGMSRAEFIEAYRRSINDAIAAHRLNRDPVWTEAIAVGSEEFVRRVSDEIKTRVKLEVDEAGDGVWVVRDPEVPYGAF